MARRLHWLDVPASNFCSTRTAGAAGCGTEPGERPCVQGDFVDGCCYRLSAAFSRRRRQRRPRRVAADGGTAPRRQLRGHERRRPTTPGFVKARARARATRAPGGMLTSIGTTTIAARTAATTVAGATATRTATSSAAATPLAI